MSYTEIDETAAGLTLGTQAASKVGFYAAAPASRPANTVVPRTALQTLGLIATGGTDTTVYTTANNTFSGANTLGNTTFTEATNITLGNTTGTKIGTATANKLGFWNATPVVQPASADQTALTDSTGGNASDAVLAAIGATNSGDVSADINNNFAKTAELVNALRSALVTAGLIKGAA